MAHGQNLQALAPCGRSASSNRFKVGERNFLSVTSCDTASCNSPVVECFDSLSLIVFFLLHRLILFLHHGIRKTDRVFHFICRNEHASLEFRRAGNGKRISVFLASHGQSNLYGFHAGSIRQLDADTVIYDAAIHAAIEGGDSFFVLCLDRAKHVAGEFLLRQRTLDIEVCKSPFPMDIVQMRFCAHGHLVWFSIQFDREMIAGHERFHLF